MTRVYALILLTLLSGSLHVAIASTAYADQCEQPKEHYINIENTRVRYVESGAGNDVVLIHDSLSLAA